LKFARNKHGRDFIIGDLHGCFDLLLECLEKVNFNSGTDRLFSTGDLIDRGPDSMECLKLIESPWFHPVIGNHEELMLNSILGNKDKYLWEMNGGIWHRYEDREELERLVQIIKDRIPYAITLVTKSGDEVGICHAQPPSIDWLDAIENPTDRDIKIMLWARSWIEDKLQEPVININRTYHGHTIVASPELVANAMFIDTGAFYTDNLTILEIK